MKTQTGLRYFCDYVGITTKPIQLKFYSGSAYSNKSAALRRCLNDNRSSFISVPVHPGRTLRSLSICPFWPAVKELVLASLDEKIKGARVHFPATTLQIPALWPTEVGELSGSDPWAGPLSPEPLLRTRAFHWFKNMTGQTEQMEGNLMFRSRLHDTF